MPNATHTLETIASGHRAEITGLLVDNDLRPELSQVVRLNEWRRIQTIRRPSDNNEDVTLYRRRNTP